MISNYYSISVFKNIPVFGGLGGGTSNAVFILKYLLKNNISNILLKKFESLIGSDLKLFFKQQGFVRDLQTVIELKQKHKFYFVLIKPKIMLYQKDIFKCQKNLKERTL